MLINLTICLPECSSKGMTAVAATINKLNMRLIDYGSTVLTEYPRTSICRCAAYGPKNFASLAFVALILQPGEA